MIDKLREIFGISYRIPPGNSRTYPYIAPPDLIPKVVENGWQIVKYTHTDGKIYYMSCLDRGLGIQPGTNNHPFCDRYQHDLTGTPYEILDMERLKILVGKKAMKTDGQFIVYIDPNFVGNYIYGTKYEIIPELNAIVIL